MKQGTANLAEDYCFIHKALRPVSKARRQIAAVPPSNSKPACPSAFLSLVDVELCRMQLTGLQMLHMLTSFFRSRLRCAESS